MGLGRSRFARTFSSKEHNQEAMSRLGPAGGLLCSSEAEDVRLDLFSAVLSEQSDSFKTAFTARLHDDSILMLALELRRLAIQRRTA